MGVQGLAPTQGTLSRSPPCCGGCTFLLLLLLPRGCLWPGPAFLFPPAPARILPTPSPQPEAPMGLVPGLPGGCWGSPHHHNPRVGVGGCGGGGGEDLGGEGGMLEAITSCVPPPPPRSPQPQLRLLQAPQCAGGVGGFGGGQAWHHPLPPRPVLYRYLEPEPCAGAG